MLTRPGEPERGTTLVELLLAMVLLGVFLAVFGPFAARLFDSADGQQARVANQDNSRQLVRVLDRQVRYANALTTPVSTPSGGRVRWRAGSPGQQQTCYEWRVEGGLAQWRTWAVPPVTVPPQPAPVPTAWRTVAEGVRPRGSEPVFALGSPVATTGVHRQQLSVAFVVRHGRTPVDTPTEVAFTAVNTRTASAPTTPVCQEVAP